VRSLPDSHTEQTPEKKKKEKKKAEASSIQSGLPWPQTPLASLLPAAVAAPNIPRLVIPRKTSQKNKGKKNTSYTWYSSQAFIAATKASSLASDMSNLPLKYIQTVSFSQSSAAGFIRVRSLPCG
jgi:hypothetical protein